MRNKDKIETEEIFYSACCGLCNFFVGGFSGILNSNQGYCALRKKRFVFS